MKMSKVLERLLFPAAIVCFLVLQVAAMADRSGTGRMEAHENGSPLIRTMFYEFPEDPRCWETEDQYMFGSEYLVAPILHLNEFEREVYLPAGRWEDIHTGELLEGGRTILAKAPLEIIPVYRKK